MKFRRKKLLLAFICFVGLIVAFVAIEHFRGAWRLKRWNARMASRGEELRIEQLAPILPAADQNGQPELIWVAGQLGSFPNFSIPSAKNVAPGKCIVITRLNEWHVREKKATNMTWTEIGQYLTPQESRIQAALEALRAEAFNANVNYRGGFVNLPMNHLMRIKSLAQFLSAATLCDLHHGQADAAFEKLQGLLALVNVQKDEPLVISQMIRIAIMNIAFTVTWQALQREGWSDAQLAQLQQAWANFDFLSSIEKSFAMERAMVVGEYERFRESDQSLSTLFDPSGGLVAVAPTPSLLSWDWVARMFDIREQVFTPLWKFAWSRQDQAHYCETIQSILETQRGAVPARSGIGLINAIESLESDTYRNPYDRLRFIMGRMVIGSLASALTRAWVAQSTCEITATALALKRYELRHGKLPSGLDELVPDLLARHSIDYMDGRPLRYCRDGEASFLLYSVGRDGRDGGGDATPMTGATSSNWSYQNGRDLLWPQPASEAEVVVWRALRK